MARWAPSPVDLKALLAATEKRYIQQAYAKYGNVRKAAQSLSMPPATFVRKHQKYREEE